jgi:hypothetical protein
VREGRRPEGVEGVGAIQVGVRAAGVAQVPQLEGTELVPGVGAARIEVHRLEVETAGPDEVILEVFCGRLE